MAKFFFPFLLVLSFHAPAAAADFNLRGEINIHVLENEKYFFALMEKIKGAKKNINVCMYLFKTTDSPNNLANQILDALLAATKRGVTVEALLEENDRPRDSLNAHNHQTAKKLKRAGIRVRFDNKEINTHSKLVVIDGQWVFLGSHNFSHTALSKSNETSVMVESKEMAEYFLKYIRNIESGMDSLKKTNEKWNVDEAD